MWKNIFEDERKIKRRRMYNITIIVSNLVKVLDIINSNIELKLANN